MTPDDEKWDRLTAWMQELSQGQWKLDDQKVTYRQVPGAGRGLFATQDIEPGSTILKIPAVTLLHPRNIERADDGARAANIPNALNVPYRMLPHSTLHKRQRGATSRQLDTRITTTETLALYLTLNRHASTQRGNSRYCSWTPYLDTLPTSFRPWHPLTWLVKPSDSCDHDDWKILNTLAENHLPKAAYEKLQDVLQRYKRHTAMLRKGVPMVLEEGSDAIMKERWTEVTEEDFLWGWLNVNTRTLYLPLDMPPIPNTAFADRSAMGARPRTEADSEQQNHSMAPLLDLANHSHLRMETSYTEVEQQGEVLQQKPILCSVHLVEEDTGNFSRSKSAKKLDAPPGWRKRTFQVTAPKNARIKKGDEIVFAYGPHPDETLFAEYGFVPFEGENPWNEVRVDDLINTTWRKRESPTMVTLKREVLEMNGYLDEYTLHIHPGPPHPSHRLLTALRLMYMQVPENALQEYIDDPTRKKGHPALHPFLELLTGARDKISDENEKAVRGCIRSICSGTLVEIEEKLTELRTLEQFHTPGHLANAMRMVEQLWFNDRAIFLGVLHSIDQDIVF